MAEKSVDKMVKKVISAAVYIHSQLGPGRKEAIYETALAFELEKRRLHVQEHPQFTFQGTSGHFRSFRMDMLVEGQILIDIMVVASIGHVERNGMWSYLLRANKQVGLLLNFGVQKSFRKEGVLRVDLEDAPGK